MRKYALGAIALLFTVALAWAVSGPDYSYESGVYRQENHIAILSDKETSASNTALTEVYELHDLHNTLSVFAVCSAGTAALTISVSVDGVNFTAVDSVTAAATTAKVYGPATTGATVAVSPLSFRFVKFSEAACGSGDTSTMTVSGK